MHGTRTIDELRANNFRTVALKFLTLGSLYSKLASKHLYHSLALGHLYSNFTLAYLRITIICHYQPLYCAVEEAGGMTSSAGGVKEVSLLMKNVMVC